MLERRLPSMPGHLWVLAILVGVSTVLLASSVLFFAAATGTDSRLHISGGTAIFAGDPLPGRAETYLGYMVVVGFFEQLGLGLVGVALFQILLAAVAAVAVYDLGRQLAGAWAGVVAAGLMASFFSLVRWHRFVLTESLAISLTAIGVWLAMKAADTKKPGYVIASMLVLGWGATVRPSGFAALLVVAVWLATRLLRPRAPRALGVTALLVGFFLIVPLTPSFTVSVGAETPASQLQEGRVIWGVESTYVAMPATSVSDQGYAGVVEYAVQHPLATASVMIRRVGWELVAARPHYSSAHNLYLLGMLIPIYLLGIWGALSHRHDPLVWLLLLVFLGNLGLVAVTFADWDSRFLMYALPMMLVLAGAGAQRLAGVVRDRWMSPAEAQ